jgi:hypothetical protein
MKLNPSISTIKALWPRFSAVPAAILLLTTPAFQGFSVGTADLLQITENSSSSLTVLWDGSSSGITVLNPTPDHWTITLPVQVVISGGEGEGGDAILEPGGGTLGLWNNVTTQPPNTFVNVVDVVSDSPTTSAYAAVLPDNVPTPGGVLSTGARFDLQFHDLGDGPGTGTVPDGASTALLALPAILALFGMARLRKSSIPV